MPTDTDLAGFARSVAALEADLRYYARYYDLCDHYYNAEQKVQNLGIAIPPNLADIHTVLGWPRTYVDALDSRTQVQDFIYSDSTDSAEDVWEIWQANDMDDVSARTHLDAFIFGTAYEVVGPGDDGQPLITAESPRNVAVRYDATGRVMLEALHVYGGGLRAVYWNLPEAAMVDLFRDEPYGQWRLGAVSENPLGVIPIVRFANRSRTHRRAGQSEITNEIRNITDAACRTLLSLEVAREFYSVPQKAMLGVDEEAFQDAEGNPVKPWDTYISKFLSLPRDDDGNVPELFQFQAYDPSVYTKVLDQYARIMSGQTGMPPEYLGIVTQNPASADSIRMSEQRLIKNAERKHAAFTAPRRRVVNLAKLIRDGELPEDAERLEVVWRDPATPTLSAMADATTKYVSAGVLPPRSRVTLQRAGFSRAEQEQILADWRREEGSQALNGILAQAQQAAQAAPEQPEA